MLHGRGDYLFPLVAKKQQKKRKSDIYSSHVVPQMNFCCLPVEILITNIQTQQIVQKQA